MSVSPSSRFSRCHQRKAWDLNPHDPFESHGLANRPGKPYPATFPIYLWTDRESNSDLRHARAVSSPWTISPFISVERRGVEPRLPGCKPSVFPLDQRPNFVQRSVRELNPVFRHTTAACCRNTYRPCFQSVIPDGIEPSFSWMSTRRLRRWTTGSSIK